MRPCQGKRVEGLTCRECGGQNGPFGGHVVEGCFGTWAAAEVLERERKGRPPRSNISTSTAAPSAREAAVAALLEEEIDFIAASINRSRPHRRLFDVLVQRDGRMVVETVDVRAFTLHLAERGLPIGPRHGHVGDYKHVNAFLLAYDGRLVREYSKTPGWTRGRGSDHTPGDLCRVVGIRAATENDLVLP